MVLRSKPLLHIHLSIWLDVRFHYAQGSVERNENLHCTHVCVFGCVAYAMVLDEQRSKFDTKGTKYFFKVIMRGLRHVG